ncbi:MAG: glycosyltransferase, partial [Candidatus Omnitrophica bacterium]|nr:glycosyltransferase [Candidatus Omnitrophota bacterium]
MRILIINHEFPPVGGGGATASGYVAKYLSGAGSDVRVITSAFDSLPKKERRDNYFIRRVYSRRGELHTGRVSDFILFIMSGFAVLISEKKLIKPDLIYAFFTLPSGVIALLAKKIYKIPYLIFLRGVDVPGFYAGRHSFLNRWLAPFIRYIWLEADAVIANSQALKQLAYKSLGERKKISVLPNMVDTAFFCPAPSPA